MAKKEDEDFPFGDFTFASSFTSSTPPNLPPISTKKPEEDDDEWGDFVKTPFGSGDDNHQNHPKPLNPPISENGSADSSGSKLKGPFPLSFFGDIEDEESGGESKEKVSEVADVVRDKPNSSSSSKKSGISDILSDLYSSNDNDRGGKSNGSKDKEIGGEDRISFDFYRKGVDLEAKDSIFESGGLDLGSGVDGVKKSGGNGDQKEGNGDEVSGSLIRSRSNVENAVSGFDFSGWGLGNSEASSGASVSDQSKKGGVENGEFSFDLNKVVSGSNGDWKGKNGNEINGSVIRSRSNVESAVSGLDFSGWGLEFSEPSSAPGIADQSKKGEVGNVEFNFDLNGLVPGSNGDWKGKNGNEINGSVNRSRSNVEDISGFNFSGWGLEYSEPNSAPSVAERSKQGHVVNDEFSFDSNRLISGSNASTSNTSEFGFDFSGWGGMSSSGGGTGSGMLKSSADVNGSTGNKEVGSNCKNTGLDGNDKGGDDFDEEEDDGWEFKGAFSENKGSQAVDITLNSDYNSNGSSPNKTVSLTTKNKLLDGSDNNANNHDEKEQMEFQGMFSEGKVGHTLDKVGPSTREPSNTSTFSTGFSYGSNNAVDLFAISDGLNNLTPVESGVSIDSSLTQDSNISKAPLNFTPNTSLRKEPSDGKAQLSSSDITIEDVETDDDFGDFTAAFSETGPNREANDGQHLEQNSPLEAYMSSSASGSHKVLDLFSMSNGSADLFSMGNAINGTSLELQTDRDTLSNNAADILGVGPTHQGNAQESNRDGLSPQSVPESGEDEDDFGDFAAAFSEAGQEALKASNPSQPDLDESTALGKDLGTGSAAGNKKGALPLSLFGEEESEVDNNNMLNTYTDSHSLSQSSGQSPTSAVSINDLISNLYSQAEQSSPHKSIGATDPGTSPTIEINSEPVHDGDDSNDDSWEFKGSYGNEEVSKESLSPEVATCSITSKARVNDYVDFYSKLQDILNFLIKGHLENIKRDGDSGKVMAVDEEIQDELKEHAHESVATKEDGFEGQATTDASLHEFIEALKDPKLQLLEAEYDLSIKLSSAENDLKSALELKKHTKTMISLLSLGSLEDQLMYVNLWSKMISICAQELQTGGKILEQSLKRNVKNELLSETQGKEFVKALGEIYRVAMVLGVSAKLYKPWTLECSAESTKMFSFIDECRSVWSTSGLEKALLDILHLVPTLVESIQYIHNLDVLALRDHVFNWQDSRCGLSLLTVDVIPGMKTVVWDGKTYFVKLANLWANMISCDPPRVPSLHEMVDAKAG